MNFYIADTHFGHSNVIGFDNRPYKNTEEMDAALIQNWNAKVSDNDDVYIVGDFCFRSDKSPDWYLSQLKGHKHLIQGNHDQVTLDCENAHKYLESIEKLQHVNDNGRQICLCHYPMAEWYGLQRGSHHIYGHIHGNKDATYEFMKTLPRAYNAGACINNYSPVTFDELVQNNEYFKNH